MVKGASQPVNLFTTFIIQSMRCNSMICLCPCGKLKTMLPCSYDKNCFF